MHVATGRQWEIEQELKKAGWEFIAEKSYCPKHTKNVTVSDRIRQALEDCGYPFSDDDNAWQYHDKAGKWWHQVRDWLEEYAELLEKK